MSVLSAHTKTVTPQGPVFAQSSDQGADNPRVKNLVITPVNMQPEGSDLIENFSCD
jgi:hypothetical protein